MNFPEKIIIKIDPELADLIPGYIENRQQDIAAMRAALEKQDFEKVRITGHSMKGSGGGYGFDAITEIGRGIEIAGKEKNAEKAAEGITDLETYLSRLVIENPAKP